MATNTPPCPPSSAVSDLRIEIDRLAHQDTRGHAIDVPLSVEFMREALSETDARVEEPGALDAHALLQMDDTLLIRGQLSATYIVPCARCLADAKVDASSQLCVTYVPREDHEARQTPPRPPPSRGSRRARTGARCPR